MSCSHKIKNNISIFTIDMVKNTKHSPRKKARPRRKKKVKVPACLAVAAAVLVLAVLIGIPLTRNLRDSSDFGASVPDISFSGIGIDISHNNQGPIVWDSLMVMVDRSGKTVRNIKESRKIYPVKFVFIKATEGISMKDPKFREYWNEAGKRDIQRGAYHFFRSSKDGEAQARNFIATVGELRHVDMPPVLDIETIHRGCSRKTLNERALKWLRTIEKHYGCKPIVYTSDSFASDILAESITAEYPVWIAHYGVDSPDYQGWDYWQFTDCAYVYGLPEPVDLSFKR